MTEIDELRAENERLRAELVRYLSYAGAVVSRADAAEIRLAALSVAPQPEPDGVGREGVVSLADEWDGGADAGRAHILACSKQPCPRCVLAEAAIDLRERLAAEGVS